MESTITQTPKLPNSQTHALPGWFAAAALVLILILGAVLRLTGVNWDEDQHLHPDERFLTMVESALGLPGFGASIGTPPPGCSKWGGYFDTACSPLNPYNHDFGLFVYGTFPIFITRVVAEAINMTGYSDVNLVGRVLSALVDLLTVLLIFFIGRRMYGTRAALLGALFLSASVLDIQQSHFFTVDTFTNVPILIGFWFAMDLADGKKWRSFIWGGIMFGLALAGRINIAPFVTVLIAAAALRAYLAAEASKRNAPLDSPETLEESDPKIVEQTVGPLSVTAGFKTGAPSFSDALLSSMTKAFLGLAGAGLLTLLVFRIAQPYAANGPDFISPSIPKLDFSHGAISVGLDVLLSWAGGVNPKFADNMAYISELVAGNQDFPPGHQWTDRPAYIFPFDNMVQWGLGLPLGLIAWAGFLYALYRLLRYREWKHLLIVVWVGVTFAYTGQQWVKTMRYFLQIYPFLALLAGYFLVTLWDRVTADRRPQTANDGGRPSAVSRLAQIGVAIITIIVVGYTVFWATAFTSIYMRPVSRVTASRWIINNVPRNSVLANEHWDDPLPLRVDGVDPYGGMYRGLTPQYPGGDTLMDWYNEDTPEKRVMAINWLDQADYIILSSNRLYGSIPRLPMRYPMTTKYYQWLFDGTLGFDNVATITSRPQLFGIEINDDNAEEAFTVYDHPKVLIFKKTARYSHDNTTKLFNGIDLSEVYQFWPRQATQAKTALLLTPSDLQAQQSGGTWSDIFHPDDLINQIPVIAWLALIEAIGWLTFPMAFVVFRGLTDRGYVFAKTFGILLTGWGAWILASYHLLPFSRTSIGLVIAAIAIIATVIAWRRGKDIANFLREHHRVILVEELVFLVFFGAFLLVRYGNPDLWHQWYGGEKPMDFSYLNAIIKSTWFPAFDPWFAGGYINYYYFGQLITATLIKFTGILPEVAYNLALPMYFAMLGAGAFSVAFNLVAARKPVPLFPVVPSTSLDDGNKGNEGMSESGGTRWNYIAGLFAALFVTGIGNLGQIVLIGQTFLKIGGGDANSSPIEGASSMINGIWRVVVDHQSFDVAPGWWYWNATRTIPDTINEFPFFSFLYADLHAHVMALPFTLLAIGVAINFVLRLRDRSDEARLPFLPHLPIAPIDIIEVIVASLVIGGLRAINYADYPTYLLVIGCALAIGEYARRNKIDWLGIFGFAWRFGAIFVLSSVLFQPFVSNFATAYLATEIWSGDHTTIAQYLIVHGIFLFPIATYLILRTFDTPARRRTLVNWMPLFVVAFILVEALFLLSKIPVFAIAFPLLVLAGLLVLRPDLVAEERFIALLIAAGLALTMMVEVITYKGDIGRMNTVFKFYLQAWVFFGVAAATGIAFISRRSSVDSQQSTDDNHSPLVPRPSPLGFAWWTIFGVLVFIGLLYPITATNAKVNDRFTMGSPSGLNGMDFLRNGVYQDKIDIPLDYDRQAFVWLRANIQGSPVVLEGNAPLYHWASPVSWFTGLPTVIGWDWHQKQQRSIVDGAIIDRRIESVRTIYNTLDAKIALAQMKRFNVSYVYVGDVERAYYDPSGLAKFDVMVATKMLQVAYRNDRVTIYKVVQ